MGFRGGDFPFTLIEQPNGDYLIQGVPRDTEYNDLELYLMGLIPAEEVGKHGEHFVFLNQAQRDQLHVGGILEGGMPSRSNIT